MSIVAMASTVLKASFPMSPTKRVMSGCRALRIATSAFDHCFSRPSWTSPTTTKRVTTLLTHHTLRFATHDCLSFAAAEGKDVANNREGHSSGHRQVRHVAFRYALPHRVHTYRHSTRPHQASLMRPSVSSDSFPSRPDGALLDDATFRSTLRRSGEGLDVSPLRKYS